MIRASFLAAGFALIAAAGSAAAVQAAELKVYPIAGVYGLERTDCGGEGGDQTAKIAKAFCPQFTPAQRLLIGRTFHDRVMAAFPGTIDNLNGQVGAGETNEAALSKTVIASLHISRADLWVVEKPGAYNIYVPITVSLFLTNALTGEVMFVENYSTDVVGQPSRDNYLDQARQALAVNLDRSIAAVIANAAARFKPYALAGTVRAKVAQRYVFDVGRKGGVRDGDTIGADARVVYSDAAYSVIEPMLGSLDVGRSLSRQVAQPIEMLRRPSALVVVAGYPASSSRGYINTVFEDALGQGAGLAVTPVNPSFAQLRTLMLGEARVSGVYENARAIPDYFIRLSVVVQEPLDLETNHAQTRRHVYEARAFVEVVDHAGRVVFATQASDRIVDEVLYGVTFSADQRRDIVIKNALVKAAAAVSKGFHPGRLRLDARPAGDDVDVADAGGALNLGAKATLLRRAGSFSGIVGDVWAPVGLVEVTSTSPAGAHARFSDVEPRTARMGDQVAYDSGAGLVQSRRTFAPCEEADGTVSALRRGSVEEPLFEQIAVNSFAAAFPAPVRLAHFDAELQPYLRQFAGASDLAVLHPRPADVCFAPVYQIEPAGEKASGAGMVSPVYQVAMGYVLRRDGQKLANAALQQTLTATGVPAGADAATRNASLQYDLAAVAADLTAQTVRSLKPPE